MKMEAKYSSETLVDFQRQYIPEDVLKVLILSSVTHAKLSLLNL
jgi:hypothetical protein